MNHHSNKIGQVGVALSLKSKNDIGSIVQMACLVKRFLRAGKIKSGITLFNITVRLDFERG